jgi:hypothetical protein
MTETYEFDIEICVKGVIRDAYSRAYAIDRLDEMSRFALETFEDSLQGRVTEACLWTDVWAPVPKAPEPEQVILPDNRMWMP